jgi:uncharacterized membrane-anchored protein YhcB (DUF1043 family)
MELVNVFTHPLTLVMAAIIGFFFKDLFNKVQRQQDFKTDLESVKGRVTTLELSLKEQHDTNRAVVRLEEQVKRLAQDIQYLLTLVRVQVSTHDKTDAS